MSLTTRKFYKLNGLKGVFQLVNKGTDEEPQYHYDTTVEGFEPDLEAAGIRNIDEHTILFITASVEDEGNYVDVFVKQEGEEDIVLPKYLYKGDTMVWSRGDLYCVSSKSVASLSFDPDTRFLVINYSDGTREEIKQGVLGYTGETPITVNGDNKIGILSHSYDPESKNFIENPDENFVDSGVTNSHIEGVQNISTVSYQHIEGKYSLPDDSAVFIIGNGDENTRYNVFTVGFDGTVHASTDVTAGGEKTNPDYKLSDIHSVLNKDWAFIGNAYADYDA